MGDPSTEYGFYATDTVRPHAPRGQTDPDPVSGFQYLPRHSSVLFSRHTGLTANVAPTAVIRSGQYNRFPLGRDVSNPLSVTSSFDLLWPHHYQRVGS